MSESEQKEQRDNATAAAVAEDQPAPEGDSSPESCPVQMYDGKPCGRPIYHTQLAYDPTLVCLMHSRDPQKSDVAFQEEFEAILKSAGEGFADFTGFAFPCADYKWRKFTAKCVFHDSTFTQNPHFYYAMFAQYADFIGATFAGGADFIGATFSGSANFSNATFAQYADFRNAAFTGGADFIGATFTGSANFSEATFTQDAHFGGTTFTGGANFVSATFTGSANFSNATFTQDAHFGGATFTQSVHFSDASFTQNANFKSATFTKNAGFAEATFTKNAHFGWAEFSEKATFMGTKFLGAAEFRETKFRGYDKNRKEMAQEFLPGPVFDLAQFSQPEKIIFYKTYLGQALFHNCDVSKLNFSLVVWRRRRGSGKWKVFEEEVDLDAAPDLTAAAGSVDERRYWLVVELYQQLKKNYDERKDYATAGDFHYGEMEMKRLATPHAEWHARLINRLRMRRSGAWEFVILTSRLVALVRRWWHRHLSLVAWYKYASQYGESYVRPAIWLGVTLLLFALLYPAVGLRYDQAKDRVAAVAVSTPAVTLSYDTPLFPGQPAADRHKAQWELFWNSCLTSVEIAAFQKEPAYQPVYPRGRLLTLTETLLTSTLAALFFLALRRQFRR